MDWYNFAYAWADADMWLAAKGQWIQSNGLAGFAMWEAGGDYKDILLNAISSGIGIDKTKCNSS